MNAKSEAIATLREFIKPGDSICCTLMHTSKSGMSRSIMMQVAALDKNGKPYIRDITFLVAKAIGVRYDERNCGVVMGGYGMNMCFAAVYDLGRTLFPDGFGGVGVKGDERRRATSRRSAAAMIRKGWAFRGRNGDTSGWDNDGGYALDYRG